MPKKIQELMTIVYEKLYPIAPLARPYAWIVNSFDSSSALLTMGVGVSRRSFKSRNFVKRPVAVSWLHDDALLRGAWSDGGEPGAAGSGQPSGHAD